MQLKARIKNLAKQYQIPAQAVLQNYIMERLLERISISNYKDVIILKGGMLISALVGIHNRTTMDMDTTFQKYPISIETIQTAILEIMNIQLDDGIHFELDRITPIRQEDEYGGFRVGITARYEVINTPLKIDITTGDVIIPKAIQYYYHSNFEEKVIKVWAYTIETILAEKVETTLRRGNLNTRMRDFYDIYLIVKTQQHCIDPEILIKSLDATCKKRLSTYVLQKKHSIFLSIQSDKNLAHLWELYREDNFFAKGVEFSEVMDALAEILKMIEGPVGQ